MKQKTEKDISNEAPEAKARVYRIEIHLHSGKTITFDAIKFELDRDCGEINRIEWEFAPSMLQPGVRCPMLNMLDLSRIEAVEYTELPA